jgi:hypothetical protein
VSSLRHRRLNSSVRHSFGEISYILCSDIDIIRVLLGQRNLEETKSHDMRTLAHADPSEKKVASLAGLDDAAVVLGPSVIPKLAIHCIGIIISKENSLLNSQWPQHTQNYLALFILISYSTSPTQHFAPPTLAKKE